MIYAAIQDNIVIGVFIGDPAIGMPIHGGDEWVETDPNTHKNQHLEGGVPLRGNYAGIGYTYDRVNDRFIPPQTHPKWILDEETVWWIPPTPEPAVPEDAMGHWEWDTNVEDWVFIDWELTREGWDFA